MKTRSKNQTRRRSPIFSFQRTSVSIPSTLSALQIKDTTPAIDCQAIFLNLIKKITLPTDQAYMHLSPLFLLTAYHGAQAESTTKIIFLRLFFMYVIFSAFLLLYAFFAFSPACPACSSLPGAAGATSPLFSYYMPAVPCGAYIRPLRLLSARLESLYISAFGFGMSCYFILISILYIRYIHLFLFK